MIWRESWLNMDSFLSSIFQQIYGFVEGREGGKEEKKKAKGKTA